LLKEGLRTVLIGINLADRSNAFKVEESSAILIIALTGEEGVCAVGSRSIECVHDRRSLRVYCNETLVH